MEKVDQIKQIRMKAASISCIPGYDVMHAEIIGQDHEFIFLGKTENYKLGMYDDSDNSLIFVSYNPNMFSFLDASKGWVLSQQEMVDKGLFTPTDYMEYDRILQKLKSDFPNTQVKCFEIDPKREGSGVSFSAYWKTQTQHPHRKGR